ncbi:MAG: arginine deiminase family protein [Candidatus Neomarinimicrobiota bacterium]
MNIGCQSMVGRLQQVLLKHPREAFGGQADIDGQWRGLNYPGPPDFERACRDYDNFVELVSRSGAELMFLPPDNSTGLDSIYTHDPAVVSNKGVVLANMGKAQRDGEPTALGAYCREHDIPILGAITGAGRLEGGDVLWLDERTVAVGEGYRTNAEGIRQLGALLDRLVDSVIAVPLPHWTGEEDVLHLLSMISPVDHDLAVVYSRLMPVPFRQYLVSRGMQLIEVPDEEYDSMACNVLAVAPRQCIMIAGNPVTQGRLESAGVEVWTYDGREISAKGAGGPTCLTRPLLRV